LSFEEAGLTYSWGEAAYLTAALMLKPDSMLQAAKNGWKYPATYEWMIIAELVDLTLKVNSKNGKAKPIDRPWPTGNNERIGKTDLPREEVIARLNRMNPKES
jgi:hypothetical protein